MRFILLAAISLILTACVPEVGNETGKVTKTSMPSKSNWTGLDYIKKNADTSAKAGAAYSDCIILQMGFEKYLTESGKGNPKQERIENAIQYCRPTGRHYAEMLLKETVKFDRKFYAENIKKFVLPDIENSTREQLFKVEN